MAKMGLPTTDTVKVKIQLEKLNINGNKWRND